MFEVYKNIVSKFAELIEKSKQDFLIQPETIQELIIDSVNIALNELECSICARFLIYDELQSVYNQRKFNSYPGRDNMIRFNKAFFVSLNLKGIKCRGQLSFRDAVTKLIQYRSPEMSDKDHVILISNRWDESVINVWRSNLVNLRDFLSNSGHFGMYHIQGTKVIEMEL